jgi:serine/threonine protein kinase
MEPQAVHTSEHRKLSDLFLAALELPLNDRRQFLEKSCGDDKALLEKVNQLLFAHQEENTPLDKNLSGAGLSLLPQAASLAETLRENQPLPPPPKTTPRRSLLFDKIGNYKILSQIGQGGMGVVYKAVPENQPDAPLVAIKLLQPLSQQETLARRFQTEYEILARLNHPNIARFIETGRTPNDIPYYVMELIYGISIDDYCDRHKLGINARLQLFSDVCSAVEYAHKKWILHRDLKPSNILVTESGQVKLLDFGISKIIDPNNNTINAMLATRTTERMLTPAYASPEQIRGKLLTVAVDIYALGVLLYFLISGRLPYEFKDPTWSEIERIICEVEPLSLRKALVSQGKSSTIDPSLENIVLMALRKEPERRYPSAAALAVDIDNYLQGRPVFARPASLTYRVQRFIHRNKRTSIVTAIVLVLVIASGLLTLQQINLANDERQNAADLRKDNEEATQETALLFSKLNKLKEGSGSVQENEDLIKDCLRLLESLQKKSQNNLDLQLQIAINYRKMGEFQGRAFHSSTGNSQGALVSYQTSIDLLTNITQQQPGAINVKLELATSLQRMGNLYTQVFNDLPKGLDYTQQVIAIREKIHFTNPDLKENLRFLISAYVRIADITLSQGNTLLAINKHNQIIKAHAALLGKTPDDEQEARTCILVYNELVNALENLADMLQEKMNLSSIRSKIDMIALQHSANMTNLHKTRLRLRPEDITIQNDFDGSYLSTGYHLIRADQPAPAVKYLLIALQRFERSFTEDPNNLLLTHNLASTHRLLGQAYSALNQLAKAKDHLQKSITITQKAIATDSKNQISQEYLALSEVILAQLLDKQATAATADEVFEHLAKAHQLYQELYLSNPTTPKAILDFLQNTKLYANLLVKYQRPVEATNLVTAALRTCQAQEQAQVGKVPMAMQYAAYADLLLGTQQGEADCQGAVYAQKAMEFMGSEQYLYVQLVQYEALTKCGDQQQAKVLAQQIIDSLPLAELAATTSEKNTTSEKK